MESSITQNPPMDNSVKMIALPMFQAKGWIRFLGVMNIIQGAFAVISLWGIIYAWLPIWVGVLLFQTAGAMEAAYVADDKNQLATAVAKLKTYFIIQGVTMLVGIIIGAIVIFTVGMGALFGVLGEL